MNRSRLYLDVIEKKPVLEALCASLVKDVEDFQNRMPSSLPQEEIDLLRRLKETAVRLEGIFANIADLAHLDSAQGAFNFIMLNVNDVVKSVLEIHAPAAIAKGLEINCLCDDQAPEIMVDQDKIVQVLNILLHNAIESTQTGVISIKTHYQIQGNHVELIVSDTGVGFREDEYPKLVICKEIIALHGGTIQFSSKMGFGTIVNCIFPLEERRRR